MTDTTITIPSQSLYTIVVYDLEPVHLNNFFAAGSDGMTDRELYDITTKMLTWLNDRVADGSHSKDQTDNLPDTDSIHRKIEIVEKWQAKYDT